MASVGENLTLVRERLAAACRRGGRRPEAATLVAVTKTVSDREVAELYRLGVRDFGENRVADGLARKYALAASDARWHMIGHLQRNKAAEALAGGFVRIHGVESEKLVAVLDREAAKLGIVADVLLEVNVSGEASKCGVAADELPALAEKAEGAGNIRLLGLMTMAPLSGEAEASRPVFRELARLRGEASRRLGRELPHLSMGMSGDYEVAAEEGATLVRIGTALFI